MTKGQQDGCFSGRYTSGQALALIGDCRDQRLRVLGVDGLQTAPTGHIIGRLDLVLDLSTKSMSLEQAARRAEQFISDLASDDIVWELVIAGA